jgi:hypothetical protein
MQWLTRSDIFLLAVSAYVAVMALVRLMQRRRDQLVSEVQQQVDAHRKRERKSRDNDPLNRDAA